MTKKDNIIVPRWFLDHVENTLRIQNNINLDKETGETCQDRNVRQSLNGIRKLLKGEELTGMERFEKLQPFLPSNLDEAAAAHLSTVEGKEAWSYGPDHYDGKDVEDSFKAGAEWMARQGYTKEETVYFERLCDENRIMVDLGWGEPERGGFNPGDKVVVQIRKK